MRSGSSASLNGSDKRKAYREREAFKAFAQAANLAATDVRSLVPPAPDIRCVIDGVERFFELVEVIDSGIAQRRGMWLNHGIEPSGGSYDEPFVERILAKLAKDYQLPEQALELLAWVDGLSVPVDFRANFWASVREAIRTSLPESQFARVWVHSQPDHTVVLVEPPVPGVVERFPDSQMEHRMTIPTYPTTVEASLAILEATPATLRALLVSVPEAIVTRVGAEGWSAKDVLAHLVVNEGVANARFQAIATQEMPAIANVDEQEALDASGMREQSVITLLTEFDRRRRVGTTYLRRQTLEALARQGLHEVAGPVSALDLLHQRAWHDLNHIRQAAALLAEPLDEHRGNLRVF